MNAEALEIVRALVKDVSSSAYMTVYIGEIIIDNLENVKLHEAVARDLPEIKGNTIAITNFLNFISAGTLRNGLKEFERLYQLLQIAPELANTLDKDFDIVYSAITEKHQDFLRVEESLKAQSSAEHDIPSLITIHNPVSLQLPNLYLVIRDLIDSNTQEMTEESTNAG